MTNAPCFAPFQGIVVWSDSYPAMVIKELCTQCARYLTGFAFFSPSASEKSTVQILWPHTAAWSKATPTPRLLKQKKKCARKRQKSMFVFYARLLFVNVYEYRKKKPSQVFLFLFRSYLNYKQLNVDVLVLKLTHTKQWHFDLYWLVLRWIVSRCVYVSGEVKSHV